MFQTEVVKTVKINIFIQKFSFRKWYLLLDNVKNCGTGGQATNDNIIRGMRFTY